MRRWKDKMDEQFSHLSGGHLQATAQALDFLNLRCMLPTHVNYASPHPLQVASPFFPAALNFQYQDPERGFDRSRVKGVVARLVRITDPSTSTALEVAAGGKLYQVVVDSEQTAKALLARGQLRNRVTIIPLNKVTSRDLPGVVRSAARKLASDKACPALDLVGYDQELAAAIKYAFGGAFVCKVGDASEFEWVHRSPNAPALRTW